MKRRARFWPRPTQLFCSFAIPQQDCSEPPTTLVRRARYSLDFASSSKDEFELSQLTWARLRKRRARFFACARGSDEWFRGTSPTVREGSIHAPPSPP